ncbi:hypothetical protein ACJMK2_004062 [Sinanodonta woodiana]|uniref:HAT C-terminal dimerisation domain-containing protein n=1 Tax=Sinanodonta woodiana TaxID=1069815 RepID=A0ABD3Y027_SINWO
MYSKRHLPIGFMDKMSRFPNLCHTTKRYLSAPLARVPRERLFSTAYDTFIETRSCLIANNMERLVVLNANAFMC